MPWRHQLPRPIVVAIPVQSATEAGAAELARVEVDVLVSEPRRQLLGIRHALEERRTLLLVAEAGPALGFAADRAEHLADRGARIAIQLCLGDAGGLEVE